MLLCGEESDLVDLDLLHICNSLENAITPALCCIHCCGELLKPFYRRRTDHKCESFYLLQMFQQFLLNEM